MREETRFESTSGGGFLAVFGTPFFLAGVAIMTSPLWGTPTMEGTDVPAPLTLVLPFGAIFTSVGAGLVFGRRGVTVDALAGTATSWWGLLAPFFSSTRPLSGFDRVAVTKEVRRSQNSTTTVYPVRLVGSDEPFGVKESQRYAESRQVAEAVAKVAGLGVHDDSSGKLIVREAGTLDESLRDRARRTGEFVEAPERPANARCTVDLQRDEMTIEVPATGFLPRHYLMIGVACLAGFMFFPFFGIPLATDIGGALEGHERIFLFVFGGFALLIGLAPPLVIGGTAWVQARTRHRVTVSPRALVVERLAPLRRRRTEIPADEVEELELDALPAKLAAFSPLVGPRKLIARSDRVTAELSGGLEPDELRWLRDTLHYVLTS